MTILKRILVHSAESPEWYYISMNHTTLLNLRPGSPIPFKDAIYTIVMKRKPLYPLTMIVAPNLILAFLTILVYLVPIDAGKFDISILAS